MLPRKRQRPNPQRAQQQQKQQQAGAAPAPAQAAAPSAPSQSQERTPAAAPAAHASTSTSGDANAQPAATHIDHDRPTPRHIPANGHSKGLPNRQNHKQVKKAQSWYGSWPRPPKASASTSVARENILGDRFRNQQRASDLGPAESTSRDDSASIHSTAASVSLSTHSKQGATELAPAADDTLAKEQTVASKPASTTDKTQKSSNIEPSSKKATPPPQPKQGKQAQPAPSEESQAPPATPAPATPAPAPAADQSNWLGWFTSTPAPQAPKPTDTPPEVPQIQLRPSTPPSQTAAVEPTSTQSEPRAAPFSWFGLWPTPSSAKMKPDSEKDTSKGDQPAKADEDVVMQDAPPDAPSAPVAQEPAPKAGSTWAFWSRDTPTAKDKKSGQEPGEIAVIGEGSEAHPQPMAEDNVSTQPKDAKTPSKAKDQKSTWRRNKRVRPASMDEIPSPSPATSTNSLPDQVAAAEKEPAADAAKATKKVDSSAKSIAESEASAKLPPNLLLPSFASTYQMKENPSILQQISNLLLRTSQTPVNHVFKVQEPPKIRKALAIGVHGLFPATYLRPMIGQPTGTSLRFAGLCADAIRRWTDSHGCQNCEIEKVALEGEGRISDRLDNLWKLLLNWIDVIRKADLIIMASHSQGVPVSIMLLEKLIDLGIITNAKIGVCAMAGVSLGPFPDYKSSFLMGSAAELWDFGNPQSQNSQRFEAALKRVLDYGARVTFIGSIDDQVVPMESAVYSPASHPYIYRAVFIDGRIHAPDFIAHLVGFALKLRNLGVSDHGLVRELSLALAGSLYSGEGHSRLYFDTAVYDLAVSHALETTSVAQPTPCVIQHHAQPSTAPSTSAALASANPYVLPWIMRGLLEEDFVKTELSSETEVLLQQFDDWKPSNKALKDVKYRLEAVRSKL